MDNIKKIDDFLDRMQGLLDNAKKQGHIIVGVEDLKNTFPELRESEDEESKKWILEYLYDGLRRSDEQFKEQFKCAIAWLEKQGEKPQDEDKQIMKEIAEFIYNSTFKPKDLKKKEKWLTWFNKQSEKPQGKSAVEAAKEEKVNDQNCVKPADKVEPKFKVGDWVVFKNRHQSIYQVEKIKDGYYILRNIYGGTFRVCVLHDEGLRLWTIQDAEDGDVLVNGSNIFIFHFIYDTRLMGYCHVNTDNGKLYDDIGKNECFCHIDAVVNPATKEQRDLLFQKMKEAGYEWNANKKEINHI